MSVSKSKPKKPSSHPRPAQPGARRAAFLTVVVFQMWL